MKLKTVLGIFCFFSCLIVFSNTVVAQSISAKSLVGTTWDSREFDAAIYRLKFVDNKTIHLTVHTVDSPTQKWIGTYKVKGGDFYASFKYYLADDSKKVKAKLNFEGWCPLNADGSCFLKIRSSSLYKLDLLEWSYIG